jgi:hypothetical protein
MLTPAPDMLSVAWKRAQLKAENHKHTDLKAERIERANRRRRRISESASNAPVSEAGSRAMSELTPRHGLIDLFGSGDFPPEILLDPAHAAEIVIQRLTDAGFKIESAGN